MAIIASELKWMKSRVVSDTSSNGGKMSDTVAVTGVKNNVFPDVTQAERTAGVTRYRKLFAKVANDADLTLYNPKVHMTETTPGNDYVSFCAATQTNTQGDLTGSERYYGSADLASNITASDTTFTATLEATANAGVFNDGSTDTIWVGDGTNAEYHELVDISITGATVTFTLDAGDQMLNNYNTSNTVVASVVETADIACAVGTPSISSASGTFDETDVTLDNIATISDTITCTFTSSTAFDVTSSDLGSLGSGNTSGDFSYNNPNQSNKPYFTILSTAWGGTWATSDTVSFTTTPASYPIFVKEVVPSSSGSYSGNRFALRINGEST